ncbi:rhomboid family intramembrane serine protease [Haloferula sp. A504]|uniref:rhomboid family intramembrane serine protease n=1 Tax=Haloferula sp. A504 TaxID=3373601 RepID=UPI0031BD730B|nr:rhomboid family intramembrane serine protease [Verrucomicrobiaceae bacterium E54]
MEELLDALRPVGRWPSLAEADERALVVLAMNRDCRVRAEPEGFVLEVDEEDAEPIEQELALYEEECREVPAAMPEAVGHSPGLGVALLWVLALGFVFLRQMTDPAITDRFMNSSIDVIKGGEWWRPLTALFLHADLEHLMGNIAIGGFFCLMVATAFGPWRGWVLVFLCGYVGNLLNAWLHMPGPFHSLGASTATFGALGLVVGHGSVAVLRSHHLREMKRLLVPLGVGLGLFGWFGIGGADTDVSAHLLGAGCGVVLGVFVSLLRRDAAYLRSPGTPASTRHSS